MREYLVPVVFRTASELIVKAENQAEAIKKTREIIKNNEKANMFYDNFKILEADITCLQDDEIIEEVSNIPSGNIAFEEFLSKFGKDIDTSSSSCEYCCAFSGADVIFSVDNRIIGEFASMNLDGSKKEISFDVPLFNTIASVGQFLSSLKNSKIVQILVNEHGPKLYRTFTGVKFLHKMSNLDCYQLELKETYFFSYEEESNFEEFSCSLEELVENA